MLMDSYKERGLFFNVNFQENLSDDFSAYRGELVLKEGEVADAEGRRKPPIKVMKHGVLLAQGDKLKLVAGFLDDLSGLNLLIERHKADFADTTVILYVRNIETNMMVEDVEGAKIVLIPILECMVWNQLMEDLGMEKGDFKGQTSGKKVVTLYDEAKTFTPKGSETVSLETALSRIVDVQYERVGPV